MGGTVSLGFGGRQQAQLGGGGATQGDESRPAQLSGEVGLSRLTPVGLLKRGHPAVDGIAGEMRTQILQQERHTAERTFGKLSTRRFAPGPFVLTRDQNVELRVQAIEARDRSLDQLEGLDLTATHQFGLGHRIQKREFVCHRRIL